MNPANEMAAKRDAVVDDIGKQLSAVLEISERPNRRRKLEDEPVARDELSPGFTSRLDREASERKAIHDRLGAIENGMKRRGSRGFARHLVAILIGVAVTLAWQSYGDAIEQIIAGRAPELGWSPEAKQMIASWTLGWTKPPASPEKQAAPVAQTAPTTPLLDPAQVHHIT